MCRRTEVDYKSDIKHHLSPGTILFSDKVDFSLESIDFNFIDQNRYWSQRNDTAWIITFVFVQ